MGSRCTADILSCLKSLQASTYRPFEIHICEIGGSAALAELIGLLSESFGVALPAAATLGAAPRIAETRSDRPAPDGLPIVVHRAESNPGYAGAINATAFSSRRPRTVVDFRRFTVGRCRALSTLLRPHVPYSTTPPREAAQNTQRMCCRPRQFAGRRSGRLEAV
jgi:hypothetical protein